MESREGAPPVPPRRERSALHPAFVALLSTALAVLLVEAFAAVGLPLPEPAPVLVLAVVYSAFTGGIGAGLLSAALVLAWFLVHLARPGGGFPPRYAPEDASRLVVLAISTPLIVVMVGTLRARANRGFSEALRAVQTAHERLRQKSQELEAQNRRIEETSRVKSEFVAAMSHELRTPLNAIIGFAEILADGKVGQVTPPQKDLLGDVLASGRHLLHLINDVLDLAKVEAGKMEIRPAPVDLPALVSEVASVMRTLAVRKRIALEVRPDPALREVVVDGPRLKQVVFNYLSNAVRHAPEGGRVSVTTAPEGEDDFRLEVGDDGPGIDVEAQKRLFVEFQQVDAKDRVAAEGAPVGTGLGLALSRRLVEAQRGRVGVRSAPGEGSVFFAVLPRAVAANGGPVPLPPTPPA
jgi:signal transduction histidine kinase